MSEKTYLGDAVYAERDRHEKGVWLTTEDGINTTNSIYLEPDAYKKLKEFMEADDR